MNVSKKIVDYVNYTHNAHVHNLHYHDTDTAVDEISNKLFEISFGSITFDRLSIYISELIKNRTVRTVSSEDSC